MLSAALEVGVRALPIALDRVGWRIGVESALLAGAPQVLLGLALLAWCGLQREEPVAVRIAAILALGAGAVYLASVIGLVVDWRPALSLAPSDGRGLVRNRLAASGVIGVSAVVAAVGLALGAWRAVRGEDWLVSRAIRKRSEAPPTPPLILRDR
jgi:hypothetical protein